MTRLLEFLIALGLVLALFLIVGLVLPSKRQLVESVESNRRMTIAYDVLNNVHRLKDWNRLLPADSAALSYSGGKDGSGTGARVDFKGGSWEIVESTPPPEFGGPAKIAFAVTDERAGSDKKSTFDLQPTGMNNRNVKITQTYEVTYGFNLLGRFNGMYLASSVGGAMKSGLGKLSNLLATIPNVDYRTPGDTLTLPTIVDVPAESILFVKAGNIDRTVDAIAGSIRSNREWINRVLASNNLEAAGPFRLVTTDYGQTKYAFDVAVPVRKKGSEGAPAEELSVKVDGTPVEYLYKPAHKSVFASFTGDMKDLDGKRNALRAWALTSGYDVTERPWESWKAGLEKSFSEEGEFDIYWALKQ